jgi:mRNA interferase RelE/StbE
MDYKVTINKKAIKTLEKISEPDYTKIKKAIFGLAKNPRPAGYKKLKGRPGFRIRQGNYRIIYEIFDHLLVVDVIAVGNRKEVYE